MNLQLYSDPTPSAWLLNPAQTTSSLKQFFGPMRNC